MVLQGTLHTVNHHYTVDQVGIELLTGTRLLRQMSQDPSQRTNAALVFIKGDRLFRTLTLDFPTPPSVVAVRVVSLFPKVGTDKKLDSGIAEGRSSGGSLEVSLKSLD
jgi:hypothetical protein